MDVNVTEGTETRLRELARQNGQDVADLAGVILEKTVGMEYVSQKKRKKLSDLAGMFYGGDGQTAENASEILRGEIDKRSGFGK